MNKTTIEYVDYTWNPVTGCLHGCPYCYARRIATRFKGSKAFPYGFTPTFHEDRLFDPGVVRKPSRVFVCSMADLFGDWVPTDWIAKTLAAVGAFNWHTFIFLTKQPRNLARYNPWPDNAWVGFSATNAQMFARGMDAIYDLDARVKFVSLEPLLSWDIEKYVLHEDLIAQPLQWLIVGAQTNPTVMPKIEWLTDIAACAKDAQIPVFFKDSLASLFPERSLRREWPAPQKGKS